jgi:hypothetical protein
MRQVSRVRVGRVELERGHHSLARNLAPVRLLLSSRSAAHVAGWRPMSSWPVRRRH